MAQEVVTIENLAEFKDKFEENLKTINGNSIVGQGNIEIQGGEGGSGVFMFDYNNGSPTTTFDEIKQAYNDGKTIIIYDDNSELGGMAEGCRAFAYLVDIDVDGEKCSLGFTKEFYFNIYSVKYRYETGSWGKYVEQAPLKGYVDEGLNGKQDVGDYALKSDIPSVDGFVNKSGDTMSGKLTISNVNGGDPAKSNEGLFVATIKNSANKTGVSSNGSIFAGDFDNTNSQFLGIRRKIGNSKIAGRYQIYADGLPAFLQVDYTSAATIKALFQYGWNPTDGTFNWGTVSDNTTTKHIAFKEDIVRERVNVLTGINLAPQTALKVDNFELSKDGYIPISVSFFCTGGNGECVNVPQRYEVVDNKVVVWGSFYIFNTSTTKTTSNSTLHAYITWMKV